MVKARLIKCLVWDLDNTLWNGVLLEGDAVAVPEGARRALAELDRRGVLHSIASKNDAALAMSAVADADLAGYFLYPQIGWGAKSAAIRAITQALRLGPEAIAFIDDDPSELAEVSSELPEVLCLPADCIERLVDMPEFSPAVVTEEASQRRSMYQSEMVREQAEETFVGPKEAFLASLEMTFEIRRAEQGDLQRAEELTLRTNQLNSTGYTYSSEELDRLRTSPDHLLLLGRLTDRFGEYGIVGLALLECTPAAWTIKLLLMSCRVVSRGVGLVMLSETMRRAKDAGVRLQAEFRPTDRNRMMLMTYRFAGFEEAASSGSPPVLTHSLERIPVIPDYLTVRCSWEAPRA
jgi:FkbH-like protein